MTCKVSIHRRWLEPVPVGTDGKPIPKDLWPRKRRYCWVVRWFGTDGKRYQVKAESKQDAESIQAEKLAEFDASPISRNAPRKVTLGEFIAEFVQLRIGPRGQRLSAASLEESRRSLDRLATFLGRNVRLANITKADATRFVASLRNATRPRRPKQKISAATVNKITRTLKAAFSMAVGQLEYIKVNPFMGIRQDKVAESPNRYVTPAEFKALMIASATFNEIRRSGSLEKIDSAKPDVASRLRRGVEEVDAQRMWWQVLVALCYTAGTRLNEAINLTWADVDFEKDAVRVIAKPEIGDLQGWRPKDVDSRIIPIPKLTVDLLTKAQAVANVCNPYVLIPTARLERIKAAKENGAWNENGRVINNVQNRWQRLCREAGITHATVHDLRRSAITNWAHRLPIHVVKELAGHANIATIQRYYLAVTGDDMNAAREAAADAIKDVMAAE